MAIQKQKLRYHVHCVTKVFAAATLTPKRRLVGLVVANSVSLIVSYLMVTDNNRMMISVRRMFKKINWKISVMASATPAATKTGENAEWQIVGKATYYMRARPTFFYFY